MLEKLREKSNRLPMNPGVYIMMDSSGKVIYVGKAKHLKNRVSSYFRGSHNTKTEAMIAKIADFDVIVVNSEFEALVLENSLIKHHMPKYNILLKDDKGYPFIRLDAKSPYPRFTLASRAVNDGAVYFGPFRSRSAVFSAIDSVSKALKLPTCKKKFPEDVGKDRPCLNYHLGHCRGYCLPEASREEYLAAIREATLVFDGKADSLSEELKAKMDAAAENLQFELAAGYRDKLRALEAMGVKQLVWSVSAFDTDVVGFFRSMAKFCFVVLHYVGGKLLDKDYEMMETPLEEDGEAVSALVRQYYAIRKAIPKNLLLPCAIPDQEALSRMLNEEAGFHVTVSVPRRGEKHELVTTANLNAREEIERRATAEERAGRTAQWLQSALKLKKLPVRIESFDISNTGNEDIVASMVVFVGGRPLKKDYRKFRMKEQTVQDDYASMAETLRRRLARYAEGDEKFSPLPDLLLLDGGKTHAQIGEAVLNEFGYDVPVFGMVKDDRHRTRALVSPDGGEVGISVRQDVFALIGRIQEETHRCAVGYHRKLRSRDTFVSRLDGIPGVGEKRRNDLLKAFRSVKAMGNAGMDELAAVVPRNIAEKVYAYFHPETEEDTK